MYLRRHLAPTRYLLGPGYVQYLALDTRIRTQNERAEGKGTQKPPL